MAILNPYSKTTYVNGTTPDVNATNLNKNEQGVYDVTEKVRELASYETNAAASAVSAASSASAAAASVAVYTDLAEDVADLTTDLSNLTTVVANHATYSTTEEVVIGTYDGKLLYRKALLISALGSVSGDTNYNHGIANVEKITIANGSHFKTGTAIFPAPFVYRLTSSSIGVYVTPTYVTVSIAVNQSSVSATIFLEYTKTTDPIEIEPSFPIYSNINLWKNKEWYAFGTSLTNISAEGKYPNYLKTLSSMNLTNKGISAGKIVNGILTEIKATNYNGVDLITIEGFCNDWYYNSPIGTLGDTTNTTYSGAIYDALTYLLQNSTATIVGITDHTGRLYNSINSRISAVNSLGLKQIDYINMFVSVCKMLNIPIIEAGQKSMINEFTANLYLVDQIHQTELGAQQYAQCIWDELKNISPRITN